MGIEIGDNYVYPLQFDDDQEVITNDKIDTEYMVRKFKLTGE